MFRFDKWFASPFVMFGKSPDRRDDLIQVVYCLHYMLDGFRNLKKRFSGESIKMLKMYKTTTSAKDFC